MQMINGKPSSNSANPKVPLATPVDTLVPMFETKMPKIPAKIDLLKYLPCNIPINTITKIVNANISDDPNFKANHVIGLMATSKAK